MNFEKINPVFKLLVSKVKEVRRRAKAHRESKKTILERVEKTRSERERREKLLSEELRQFKERQAEELRRKEELINQTLSDYDQRIATFEAEIEKRSKPLDWREREWKKIRAYARISGMGRRAIRRAFELARKDDLESTKE